VFVLTFSPYAHAAETSAFGINDPFTDAIQLWSAVVSSIDALAHQFASAFESQQTRTAYNSPKPHAPKTLTSPVLAASAALATQALPETATTSGRTSGTSIARQQPLSRSPPTAVDFHSVSASPRTLAAALPASPFVTHDQFNTGLSALGSYVRQLIAETASNPIVSGPSAPVSLQTFAPSQRIDNLNNVTITNANLTASEIPTDITAANYLPLTGGTLSGDLTVGGNFTAGSISFSAASSTGVIATDATTTNLVATNATSTNLFSTTASSTNLFAQTAALGSLTANSLSLNSPLAAGSGGTGWSNIAAGAILYGNGASALATSSSLYWDGTNNRLGIGTTSPSQALSVSGNAYVSGTTTSSLGFAVGSNFAVQAGGNVSSVGGYGTTKAVNYSYGASSASNNGFYWQGSGAGNCSGNGLNCSLNTMLVNSDSVVATTSGAITAGLNVNHNFGGGQGGFDGVDAIINMTSPTQNTGNTGYYVALDSTAQASANDTGTSGSYSGHLYGIGTNVRLTSGATYWQQLIGQENDLSARAGSSVNDKIGLQVVELADDAVAANRSDIGISLNNSSGATGWKLGLAFGAYSGYNPMASTGTLIGTYAHGVAAPGSGAMGTVANGIDFSNYTFTGKFLNSVGFSVDGFGNVISANASTTQISAYSGAYFGATATSTFNSAGALTLASALTTGNGGMGTTTWQTNSIPYFNGAGFTEANAALNFNGTKLTANYASTTALNVATAAYFPGSGIWNSSGNVGIGHTLPSYALDVAGFINTDQYSGYKQAGNTILFSSSTNAITAGGISALANYFNTNSTAGETAFGYQALQNATSSTLDTAMGYLALKGSATISSTGSNTAFGYKVLTSNTSGNSNNGFGTNALIANTAGSANNGFGNNALNANTTGTSNDAFGHFTLSSNTTGGSNNAFGRVALQLNTTGAQNSAFGENSLQSNTTGSSNAAFGHDTSHFNGSATNTVAIGYQAARGTAAFNAQGYTMLGYKSGTAITTGADWNTLLGYAAGNLITTGADNILIGAASTTANSNLTTGSQNILVGDNISLPSPSANGQLDIGNLIYGTGLGSTGSTVSAGNVGIGTTTPGSLLSLNNIANFTTATSTFYSTGGINLAGGCFAIAGNCLSHSNLGGTVAIANGGTGSTTLTGLLKGNGSGVVQTAIAGVDFDAAGAAAAAFPFTPTSAFGSSANATSTLIGFANGLYSLASSTIGNGTQAGGLTISGGATTTGNAYFTGTVGIGTTLSSAAPSNSIGARGNVYGGGTWLTGLQPLTTPNMISNGSLKSGTPTLIAGPTTVFTPSTYCETPGLVRLQTGLLYLTYSCGTTDGSFDHIIYYQTSTDNGATWSAQQTVSPSPGTDPHDNALTLLNSGKVILSYMLETSGLPTQTYVMIGNPTPTGIIWGNPISVSTSNFDSNGAGTTAKVLELQNGTLMLPIYGTLSGGSYNSTAVVFSSDGGLTWGGQVTVAAGNAPNEYNEANAVQLPSGRIVMLIRHDAGTTGYAYSYSDDNGATWSSPTNIIADSLPGRPSIILLGYGGIFFMGRGYNGSSGGIIASASWDNGATWTATSSVGTADGYDAMVLQASGDIGAVSARGSSAIQYREFADGYGLFSNGYSLFKNTVADVQNGSFKLSFDSTRYMTLTNGSITANAATNQNNDLGLSMLGGSSSSHGAIIFSTGASSLTEKMRITQSGNVGIGNSSPSNKLSVTGNVDFSGNTGIGTTTPYSRLEVWGPDSAASTTAFLVANNASTTEFAVLDNGNATLAGNLIQNSDQRLKTDIQSLDASSSLAAIDALNPVTFNWIDPAKGATPQLGFIAQQVLPIFPNLISTTSATALTPDGTLSLNYIGLIAPIVRAIQVLSNEIASLESTITEFAQTITSQQGHFTNELCVGSTCVTPTQFQAMVAAANQSGSPSTPPPSSGGTGSTTPNTPPVVQINGDNPATVAVGASYNDLGDTITGPQADLNLGITTYVNGIEMSPVQIETSTAATDTIDYVVTDNAGLAATSTRTVIIEAPSIVPVADASSTAATSTP